MDIGRDIFDFSSEKKNWDSASFSGCIVKGKVQADNTRYTITFFEDDIKNLYPTASSQTNESLENTICQQMSKSFHGKPSGNKYCIFFCYLTGKTGKLSLQPNFIERKRRHFFLISWAVYCSFCFTR